MTIPRIRGRVAEIETPVEHAGKFAYEMSIWDLAGEKQAGEPFLFGPFETEEIAKEQGREIVKKASQALEKEMTGEVSNRFLDMKNGGVMRPWDEQ